MPESTESSRGDTSIVEEVSSAVVGFDVFDRNADRVGTVVEVNLARTCVIVEARTSRFRRRQRHAVHVSAVDAIDLDSFAVSLTVTMADVSGAPDFRELDADCETELARYYRGLV